MKKKYAIKLDPLLANSTKWFSGKYGLSMSELIEISLSQFLTDREKIFEQMLEKDGWNKELYDGITRIYFGK